MASQVIEVPIPRRNLGPWDWRAVSTDSTDESIVDGHILLQNTDTEEAMPLVTSRCETCDRVSSSIYRPFHGVRHMLDNWIPRKLVTFTRATGRDPVKASLPSYCADPRTRSRSDAYCHFQAQRPQGNAALSCQVESADICLKR
jgi:hypothetical protein